VTDQEIEEYRKRLNDLTAKCSEKNPESSIKQDLINLARKVGASTITHTKDTQIYSAYTWELISNIHQALQTASMSNMCRKAREGYEIADKASNNAIETSKKALRGFWITSAIALISAVASVLSALAAWKATSQK